MLYFVSALAGVPLWTFLARRMGKHRALAVAALAYAIVQASVLIAPHGLAWSVLAMAVAGIPFSAGPVLLRAMMADLSDEERLASGVDRSGLLFGLLSGAVKIGSAAGVIASTNALELIGFQAELAAVNEPQALTALAICFAMMPAVLSVCAAILIAGHKLDGAAHDAIRLQLEQHDARRPLSAP